ncbi:hypothetical protein GCM10023334_044080 [Nonomuraea thailandensis]
MAERYAGDGSDTPAQRETEADLGGRQADDVGEVEGGGDEVDAVPDGADQLRVCQDPPMSHRLILVLDLSRDKLQFPAS